ncbi:tail fiber domain-containing protein [Clostridium fessum]|uniref:tail fiber domain-containing protein n=1 Tax=Clostridium fessum TaxID=2126740 RepID=UPI003AF1B17B
MNKAYIRINWENYPSDATPINKVNLNRLDSATDILDDRVITLDTTKATKTEVATLVSDVTFEESTGIITITKKNGSKVTLDTQMEKIAVNFDYDPTTEKIMLTLIDGTKQYIDLSALITQYEFLDTDTVAFTIGTDGKVSAVVKEGSIEEKHLEPNYLAKIKGEAAKAETSRADAAASATKAESYAVGGTGSREGEDSDNAKYYYQQAKDVSEGLKGGLQPHGTCTFADLPALADVNAGWMFNISDEFTTTDDFKEGSGNVIPAGANIYKTSDGKWDVLAGTPVTGVKGAKEAAYRRGNVNLTAADVGAVAEDGDASDVAVTFSTADERTNIATGEKLSALFGKIAKWLSDLKTVAFTGSYSDLTDKPTIPSNTWRPVQDNLTTASSTDCLSANMGKYLYETKANSNHTHDSRYYTETEVNNLLKAKMPVSGGTFTGAVGFANGVWNPVGDDCCVGDFNIGGCVAFKSLSAALTGIALVGAGSNAYGRLLVQNDGGDMYLATNGAFYVSNGNNSARAPIYASAFTQSSSRRVKKNIEDMTETEAKKLLDVEVKSYDYINPDMPDGCFGCIAEDMAKIIPSCVNGDVDCADDDVASIQGIGIDYSKLVPHLIKMVQIQQAQIDAQQEQIDKLAAQLL